MLTHTFTRGWTNGGATISKQVSVQSGAELNVDESIPALTTDALVAFAMDVSQIKGLYIVSDHPLTLETNSSGSPVNTITLAANTPFVWVFGDAALRDTAGTVITTDITAIYATNPHATLAAALQIRCLYDPTV